MAECADFQNVPLFCAVYAGDVKAVQKLIKKRTDVLQGYCHNGRLYTPLHIAVESGEIEICKELVDLGAPVCYIDSGSIPPLSLATKDTTKHREILDFFLGLCECDVNVSDEDGDCPLHYAACNKNKYAVERLLGHGANPNARNMVSVTPLWDACKVGSFDIVRLLTQHGASLCYENTKTKYLSEDLDAFPRSPLYDVLASTPFLPAAENIVYYLVESGYDLTKENWIISGNYPLSLPQEGTSLTRWLVKEAMTPRSLQVLCQSKIKRTIQTYPKGVEELELPKLIRDFILHKLL